MLDYEHMSKRLNIVRKVWDDQDIPQYRRLKKCPITNSSRLFNSTASFPCWELAPNFVLKIVDELIYCGLNPKK